MTGLRGPITYYFWFMLVCILISYCATGMCLLISSLSPSVAVGNLICIIVMMFMLLFGGLLLNNSILPPGLNWIKWLRYRVFFLRSFFFVTKEKQQLCQLCVQLHDVERVCESDVPSRCAQQCLSGRRAVFSRFCLWNRNAVVLSLHLFARHHGHALLLGQRHHVVSSSREEINYIYYFIKILHCFYMMNST